MSAGGSLWCMGRAWQIARALLQLLQLSPSAGASTGADLPAQTRSAQAQADLAPFLSLTAPLRKKRSTQSDHDC